MARKLATLRFFQNCHKYISASEVSFDVPDQSGPSQNAPTAELRLPAGLAVALRLLTDIDLHQITVGDLVDVCIEESILENGKEWVPKGAIAHGWIRCMERSMEVSDCFVAGLEFFEFEFGSRRISFAVELVSTIRVSNISQSACTVRTYVFVMLGRSGARIVSAMTVSDTGPKLSGVSLLYVSADYVRIFWGFRMVWRTK